MAKITRFAGIDFQQPTDGSGYSARAKEFITIR
jgi:hypothetical protein